MKSEKSRPGGHDSHKGFDDPEMFAKRFDAPERDVWQKPDQVISSFDLPDDAVVAELGVGTGYFAVRLARYLRQGKVVGLDEEPKMVAYLRQRAAEMGLTNIDVRLATGDTVNLHEKIDLLLCVDTYHHIPNRVSYFSRFIKHLKADAKLVIIDRIANSPVGPPVGHRVPAETVKKEMKAAGFEPTLELNFLSPYQFYLGFKSADSGDEVG